jgi:hypothetical protein
MLARPASIVLLMLLLTASSGCCRCCRGWHGRNFCDSSCGECYWSEWFNDPPACCDPCDCYGNYSGPRHRVVTQAGYHAPEPTLASPEMIESSEEMPTPATPIPSQPGSEATESQSLPGTEQPSVPQPSEIQPNQLQPTETLPGQDVLETMPDGVLDDSPLGEVPASE